MCEFKNRRMLTRDTAEPTEYFSDLSLSEQIFKIECLFVLTDKEVIQRGRVIERGEVAVGTQLVQAIPPGLFWRFHITVHHPEYVKFNISLTRDALLGIYGRRNIPPTHTQVTTRREFYMTGYILEIFITYK